MLIKNDTARKQVLVLLTLSIFVIYIIRLFYIQIIEDRYILSANNNVLRYVTQYPARGLIYDRNGNLLVYNEAVYDIMVSPSQVKEMDTLKFCELIDISIDDFRQKLKAAKIYSRYKSSMFEKQISKETYGYFEEQLYKFPGFYVQPRTLRKYPKPIAAHLLGYIGEVTPKQIETNTYYKSGDYIGISGIEHTYEADLRGIKGIKIRMVDVHNREVGSFRDGKYDTVATMGKSLHITIDTDIQEYAEKLMMNKKGSIVAIEPKTGEILAFVSSPAYDPNLLTGRIRGNNFVKLLKTPTKPLLNRALMGLYPPGSTFKMAIDLVSLQEEAITNHTTFSCQGVASQPIKCTHSHASPLGITTAIQQSCNPFHWMAFKVFLNSAKYGSFANRYNVWRNHILSLGFGKKLNTDLYNELSGNIPKSEKYDKIYGKKRWNAMTIRSLSIGQGEILVTPVQLANYAATIANKGYYITPHIIKQIEGGDVDNSFIEKHYTTIAAKYYDIINEGMRQVVTLGTARWYQLDSISMCGKTGTVQNPHGKDHSLYIAFAPANNPKIAIAVVIENAGFGSTWAVPIASLIIEKYLKGSVKRKDIEENMINVNLL